MAVLILTTRNFSLISPHKDFKGWKSGNAGVNAWGVENIFGLIVESKFIPAKIYVTTLPETDFYRGLTRMQGTPFFNVSPKYAFLEIFLYLSWKFNNLRYLPWQTFAAENETCSVIEKAVKKLKEMDTFLKEKGFIHVIFISPSKNQVMGREDRDNRLLKLFGRYELKTVNILDKIKLMNLSVDNIFYDSIHLNKKGHEIWGNIIKNEIKKAL